MITADEKFGTGNPVKQNTSICALRGRANYHGSKPYSSTLDLYGNHLSFFYGSRGPTVPDDKGCCNFAVKDYDFLFAISLFH
jgi:hypothetical protein